MTARIVSDKKVAVLLDQMRQNGVKIATAESLTCGWISATLARISGASDVVNGGFSVYNDTMKATVLGVPSDMLEEHTAVSEPVARAMAEGALQKSKSNIAVSVTGYAGSTGGLAPDSDAGLVYIGLAWRFNHAGGVQTEVFRHQFPGKRNEVRVKTVNAALAHVADRLKKSLP